MRYEAVRRIEREKGILPIDRAKPTRVALAFPNKYSVGMASLGFQIVYALLNENPLSSCERVFFPDDRDLAEHLRTGKHLVSHESQSAMTEFNLLAFSVSFELDYPNLVTMLRLAGLPVRAEDRDERHPLVIAGGPCATFNPEPLAEFVDAFVVGDAEVVISQLIDTITRTSKESRDEQLHALLQLPSVYVPRYYRFFYGPGGSVASVEVDSPAPARIKRAIAGGLDKTPAYSRISTPDSEFGDICLIETIRGCGRQCRFCVAGYINRPPRARKLDRPCHSSRIGLVGAAVFDHPDVPSFCEEMAEAGCEFTVSSLRLETIDSRTAKLLGRGGQKTITVAPESADARVREVINKTCSEDQIRSALASVARVGIKRVKLYFMVGLPTETDEAAAAIATLVRDLAQEFPSISFHVSLSSFVPKPWTPFQWLPMERESVLKQRVALVRRGLAGVRRVKLSAESPRLSIIQGILARGDRRQYLFIEKVAENGGDYAAALRETNADEAAYILHRVRGKNEVLPWDHIDVGISKDYLWRELERSWAREATLPCDPSICRSCGVCE